MAANSGWLRSSFRLTHAHYLGLLRRFWVWLLALGILSLIFDELTMQIQRQLEQLDSPPMSLQLLLVLAALLWGLLTNAILVILASVGMEDSITRGGPTSALAVTHKNLVPLTIELMRALGVSLCWSVLLIVPGVIKYIRFTFVPYIVLFDPAYQRGEVDALEKSERLARGRTWGLLLVMLAFMMFLLILNVLDQTFTQSFMENPVGTVLTQVFSQLGSLYFAVFLFAIYKSLNMIESSASGGTHESRI